MGYNIARLTLYAILSAIEEDLRNILIEHSKLYSPSAILPNDLYEKALMRYQKDSHLDDLPDLRQLLNYVDFGDTYQLINSNRDKLPPITAQYISSTTEKLDTLIPIRNRVAHSRPLNYKDLPMVEQITNDLILSDIESKIWVSLKDTVNKLKNDNSFVLDLGIPTYYVDEANNSHNLPIPDFDETGLIGRNDEVDKVINACLGTFPVITIIGDGGIGKTALALKAAYDLLERDGNPFEAVVWTSSKTSQLTGQEIRRIENAIETSLGMFQDVASHLAGDVYENPIDEILEYLREFRILLIIDNLETVLDDRIRSFLERLPTGSKILITSRIGLGAFEFPIKLQPLDAKASVELMRAIASRRNVEQLVKTDNNTLIRFANRMHNNPLFIKWFVTAVSTGRRPEDVLGNPNEFLKFCMSNVYHYLDTLSQDVLRVLQVVPNNHSQAELVYLSDMNIVNVQQALTQLLATNMVQMDTKARGSTFETLYTLSDLARQYLSEIHPPSQSQYTEIQKRKQQLVADSENYHSNNQANRYSIFNVTLRSPNDIVVARYLKQALILANKESFREAEQMIEEAKQLAPEYYEVHRVEAWVNVQQQRLARASENYKAAIELAEGYDIAPILLLYGGFLLRYENDVLEALKYLKRAYQMDRVSIEIRIELARAYLYSFEYDHALNTINALRKSDQDKSLRDRRKIYDLYLQVFQRQADHFVQKKHYVDAVQSLYKLREAYETCDRSLVDSLMTSKLAKAVNTAEICSRNIIDQNSKRNAEAITKWLIKESQIKIVTEDAFNTGDDYSGIIQTMPTGQSFGFIKVSNEYPNLFFHKNDLYDRKQWEHLVEGDKVTFTVGRDYQGQQIATKVRPSP